MINVKLLLTAFLIILLSSSTKCETKTNISCLSPSNENIDWFIIYLLPEKEAKGLFYSYADSNTKSFKNYKYNENTFPPLSLVKNLNKAERKFMWNDDQSTDDTKKYSESKAHSKGMLAYDNISGFHLLHSLPRFPNISNKGEILFTLPSNAGHFGQTFLCLSISNVEGKKLEKAVDEINPFYYDQSSKLGNLQEESAINTNDSNYKNDKLETNNSDNIIVSITTLKKLSIQLFLKKKKDSNLPWEGEIQNYYEDGFYVETWTRPSILPNVCKKNRETLGVTNLSIDNIDFSDNADHSKWGVSVKKKICCYGDLNRTESQKKRSGMVMCFENKTIGTQISSFITEHTCCGKKKALSFLE